MKYCEANGCRNKVSKGKYCSEHSYSKKRMRKQRKKKDIYHHENKSFYRSDTWKRVADYVYERESGRCQRCGKFVYGRSAHRHHVVPIKDNPNLKLDPNNIRLLCPKCHVIEENESKPKAVFASYFDIAPPTK